jgi:hypothetical protein
MMIMILDSKTASSAIQEGLELCIHSVIPSLFPLFLLSNTLTSSIIGAKIPFLRPLGRLCAIPQGAESILLTGLLGGYPLGAQLIGDAYNKTVITRPCAERMLGFCSNAGPAFIFGILGRSFDDPWIPWIIWLIQILSAIITGILLPKRTDDSAVKISTQEVSIPDNMNRALRSMASVCGWVLIFRVVIQFLDKWMLFLLPVELRIFICGLLELSNGGILLQNISNQTLRMIIASTTLSFGGLCVTMQTASVTGRDLGLGMYFPGKILQSIVSLILTLGCLGSKLTLWILIFGVIIVIYDSIRKIVVAFPFKMIYNSKK